MKIGPHPWRRGALAITLTAALVGSAFAAPSNSTSESALFVAGSAQLSSAGQRWLASVVSAQAQLPHRLVVVALPGSDSRLQRQRALALRSRLSRLGVSPEQIYFEAS
jgi:hypothetical protein